jgi:hypothetical protein
LLGGKLIQKPKNLFLYSVLGRVLTLVIVFAVTQEVAPLESIYFLLIGLIFKNVLSGVDLSIYNHYFKVYLNNGPVHFKAKEFITSLSLISSYPVYLLLNAMNPQSPVLFDIVSYLFLLLIVCFTNFPAQKVSSNFLLKKRDLFMSMYSSPRIPQLLSSLFVLSLLNTLPFNYSYNYFLEEANMGGVEILYGILGLSFLVGNWLSKNIYFTFSRWLIFCFYVVSIIILEHIPLTVTQTMSFFAFINIFFSYNLYKINTQYFPSLKPEYTSVLSSLYSIVFLMSSIIGSWLLVYNGFDFLIQLFLLSVFSIVAFSISLKFVIFSQEKSTLKDLKINLKYFSFRSPANQKFFLIYCDEKGINASFLERSSLNFFLNFFASHSKVYSEVVERYFSKKQFSNELYMPLSNGCACHLEATLCEKASMHEILERDSIILHYMFEIPPLYKQEVYYEKSKLKGSFYFFLTADPSIIACFLYGENVLGYSTVSANDFKRGKLEICMSKALEEYFVTYSTHKHNQIKSPNLLKTDHFEHYFKKHQTNYSPSSLMNNILVNNPKYFDFLAQEATLKNAGDLNDLVWKNNYFFKKIEFDITTEFKDHYGRYFSYPSTKSFAYPIWPCYSSQYLSHLQSRVSERYINKIVLQNKPCPII